VAPAPFRLPYKNLGQKDEAGFTPQAVLRAFKGFTFDFAFKGGFHESHQ
jgi:hypothetical protein